LNGVYLVSRPCAGVHRPPTRRGLNTLMTSGYRHTRFQRKRHRHHRRFLHVVFSVYRRGERKRPGHNTRPDIDKTAIVVPSVLVRCEFSGAVSSRHVLLSRGEPRVRHFLAGLGMGGLTTANVPASSVPARARICFGPRAVRKCRARSGLAAVTTVSCIRYLSLNQKLQGSVRPTGPNVDHTAFAFYAPSRSISSLPGISGRWVILT
jgi:hypothetical protein